MWIDELICSGSSPGKRAYSSENSGWLPYHVIEKAAEAFEHSLSACMQEIVIYDSHYFKFSILISLSISSVTFTYLWWRREQFSIKRVKNLFQMLSLRTGLILYNRYLAWFIPQNCSKVSKLSLIYLRDYGMEWILFCRWLIDDSDKFLSFLAYGY